MPGESGEKGMQGAAGPPGLNVSCSAMCTNALSLYVHAAGYTRPSRITWK